MFFTTEKIISLSGVYGLSTENGALFDLRLPGTLDESSIGSPDEAPVQDRPSEEESAAEAAQAEEAFFEELELPEDAGEITVSEERFRRKYRHDGTVRIYRMITFNETQGKRLFLDVERARVLRLFIDDKEVRPFRTPTLLTPYTFEVTGLLQGSHMLAFLASNTYAGLPETGILNSNTASEDTQTNWNGLLGRFSLREEDPVFLSHAEITSSRAGVCDMKLEICSDRDTEAELLVSSEALAEPLRHTLQLSRGRKVFVFRDVPLSETVEYWDEEDSHLYEFEFDLNGKAKQEITGFRLLNRDEYGRLYLNGRRLFVRAESEFSLFPEYGHEPMDYESWKERFLAFRKYGVNTVRFVSHVPPDNAFSAADDLGMLIFAELSQAECEAFSTPEALRYYEAELFSVLREYASHPSFIGLSFGDRLYYPEEGLTEARKLLKRARETDGSRLFSIGSCLMPGINVFNRYDGDYYLGDPDVILTDAGVCVIRDLPLLKILPDFRGIDHFSGLLEPDSLLRLQKTAGEKKYLTGWQKYLAASGESALLSCRNAVEKAFLDDSLSGISLFSLHDYGGKGGRFHGMLNSHLQKKSEGFSEPARFLEFFSAVHPLFRLERHAYEYGEVLEGDLYIVNYSKEDIFLPVSVTITGSEFMFTGGLEEKRYPRGRVTLAGHIRADLRKADDTDPEAPEDLFEPCEVTLTVQLGKIRSTVPLFIYPALIPLCPDSVTEADALTEDVMRVLEDGGTVFFTPPCTEEYLPGSVPVHYTPGISGKTGSPTYGLFCDESHPLFRYLPAFPQWDSRWENAAESRAVYLPEKIKSVIFEMDLREEGGNLSRLFEARVLNGNILFSGLGLKERILSPEARFILQCLYDYLDSYDFSPSQEIEAGELKKLFRKEVT